MTREQYIALTKPLREDAGKAKAVEIINKILTGWIFCSYPCILAVLLWRRDPVFLQTFMIPLIGFIMVSVFRYLLNRRRPYEKFGLPPVIPKKTVGKSFPSRHVFSAMIIALAIAGVDGLLPVGIAMCIAALILGVVRVWTGIHYPSDVLAGVAAAIFIFTCGNRMAGML